MNKILKKFHKAINTIDFLRMKTLLLVSIFLLLACSAEAQTNTASPGLGSGQATGAYQLSAMESINYFSGRLNFRIPVFDVKGRGEAGFPLYLNLVQDPWQGYNFGGDPPFYAPVRVDRFGGIERLYASKMEFTVPEVYAEQVSFDYDGERTFCGGVDYTLTKIYFVTSDGNYTEFRDDFTQGEPKYGECANAGFVRGAAFTSSDGTFTKFISDTAIRDNHNSIGAAYQYKISGYLYQKNGDVYRFENGKAVWLRDRNGNLVNFTGGISDSLGRKIQKSSTYQEPVPGGSPGVTVLLPYTDTFTYKGFGGSEKNITVQYVRLQDSLQTGFVLKSLSALFYCSDGEECDSRDTGRYNPTVASEVTLPDGRKYKLKYNSHGEVSRIELPTGGAIEYSSKGVPNGYAPGAGPAMSGITERRVYTNGSTLDHKMVINRNAGGANNNSDQVTEVNTYDANSAILRKEKHYYYGNSNGPTGIPYQYPLGAFYGVWKDGLEYQTETYAEDGTTLLTRINTDWQQNSLPWFQAAAQFSPKNKPKIASVTTLLADANLISKKEFVYDSFGNVTDTIEYDFGIGSSGAFLRRSHTDYLTTNPVNNINYTGDNIHILNLPSQKWVSSDAAGNNKVSFTKFEYDNYSDVSSDLSHDPLLDRPDISGHDAAFGTNYLSRGNLTAITGFANANNTATGGISSYRKYDIAGNPIEVRDAKGYASFLDYADRFGAPDAEARANTAPPQLNGLKTYAFVTKSTNPAGYTNYGQFDYFTGAAVDTEDIHGSVSSTFYNNDPLDRPTQIIQANNHPQFRRRMTINYDDVAREVTMTSDSKMFNDNLLKVKTFYDKMGRAVETWQYETATDFIATQQRYDALSRVYKSSNPFRPNSGESPQWTISKFDSLGRVTEVKTPDNAVVTRGYSGTTTTVIDQALRKRSGTTDAIGRLLRVNEDPNGVNYETTYLYDVLGRLRKTTQTEGTITQNRYFMYNDLGRLIRAKQPEQIANTNLPALTDPISGNSAWSVAYNYDDNGNVISTTDANNRSITGIYDNLNRLTTRDYSDSATPDVSFTFDDSTVAYSKGQLTAITSTASATQFTAFDELGRVKSSRQITNGQTYNMPDYTYDLSGALVAQTYPSLRVVTTETDTVGRLSKVLSQFPSQNAHTYLSDLSYTAFGAVKSARLGNGAWESAQFDAQRLQIKQIGLGASLNDTSYLKLEYAYGATDNNGSLRQQKITVQGAPAPLTQNYDYDALNRLHSATESYNNGANQAWKQTFAYDRFGNRRFDTSAGATSTLPQNNGTYNPNIDQVNNRFTVAEGYNYDNEGNLKSDPESQLFAYDSENHQTQVQGPNGTAHYFYDGSGKRVRKVVGTQETIFVYDAFGKMVAEYTLNQTITAEGTKYLTADALGSPRAITDLSAHVKSRHDYMPFGEEVYGGIGGRTAAQGYLMSSDGVRQQFTGYERDTAAGIEPALDYAQARYLSSRHGRFTSVDPLTASASIKNPQTFNRYSYVHNNPLNLIDPTGMCPPEDEPCPTYKGVEIPGHYANGEYVYDFSSSNAGLQNDSPQGGLNDNARALIQDLGQRRGPAMMTLMKIFSIPVSTAGVVPAAGLVSIAAGSGGTVATTTSVVAAEDLATHPEHVAAIEEAAVPAIEETFEILDGVRRAKIFEQLGQDTIPAQVVDAEGNAVITNLPLDRLLSPKSSIEMLNNEQTTRFFNLFYNIQENGLTHPIVVTPGSSGIPIGSVGFVTY